MSKFLVRWWAQKWLPLRRQMIHDWFWPEIFLLLASIAQTEEMAQQASRLAHSASFRMGSAPSAPNSPSTVPSFPRTCTRHAAPSTNIRNLPRTDHMVFCYLYKGRKLTNWLFPNKIKVFSYDMTIHKRWSVKANLWIAIWCPHHALPTRNQAITSMRKSTEKQLVTYPLPWSVHTKDTMWSTRGRKVKWNMSFRS